VQQIADRIKETTATVGVGALALAGAATGYRPFSAACAIGDTCYYAIEGVNADGTLTGEWEVGFGTYSALNTFTRTTVLTSSNAGAPVNFSAGTKQVWLDLPAAHITDFARLSQANVFAAANTFNAEIGVRVASATDASIFIGAPSGAATTLHAEKIDATAPSTATVALLGVKSILRTAAAVFTLAAMTHFSANAASVGAGSSVTTAKGFEAANAIAVGTNNYGYWTDFAAAANKYAFYGSGTAQSYLGGPLGILSTDALGASALIAIGGANSHPATGTAIYGSAIDYTVPATATSTAYGRRSVMRTVASAFTVTSLAHFTAEQTVKGAGSTITNVRGFYAANAIAVGTNNYGFYSDINSATTTYQLAMQGTATSYFMGSVGIGGTNPGTSSALTAGLTSTMTAASIAHAQLTGTAPSTATANYIGLEALMATTATAYTVTNVIGFYAELLTKGAGSTITNAYGFYASNAWAVGTNNYGFYSAINNATTTYQLAMAGTAPSYFGGPVAVLTTSGLNQAVLTIGLNNNHPATGATIYGQYMQLNAPSTATSAFYGHWSRLDTVAAAFTLTSVIHYEANTTSVGAGSTITNVYGFRALTGIATGANNFGFWSNIAAATNTYQLSMQGSAASRFGGPVYHAQDNSTTQAVSALFQGTGVPNNANGNNGDFYLRGDTPGTANQRLYVKSAGAWVGIA
jgi:hypothetical protein